MAPFLFLQRRLHREIQAIFLLITRRGDISLALFSLLFFPGILLHEMSHFLMARVLGVRTGRISLIPQPLEGGRLQLGFVETARTDLLRDAFIGAAPMLTGGLVVAYAGMARLGLPSLWTELVTGTPQPWTMAILRLANQADFWLWFYLIFSVSSTMMPSASDRRAWLPVGLVMTLLLIIGLWAGAGPWLLVHFTMSFNAVMRSIAAVVAISFAVHCLLLAPMLLIRRILEHLTGSVVT